MYVGLSFSSPGLKPDSATARPALAGLLIVLAAGCGGRLGATGAPTAATPTTAPAAATATTATTATGPSLQHPRLLVTPAMLADLRARAFRARTFRARTADADLGSVISGADALVARGVDAGYQGTGYADAAQVAGLAYLVSGDARYAKPLLDMLDHLNTAAAAGDLGAISVDSTFASRSTGLAVALAYDWIYPELGATRRAATVRTVNAYFDYFLKGDRVFERDGPGNGNYFAGHLLGFGAMGYATAGDNPRSSEITTKMRGLFDANIPALFTTGPAQGGFPVEGYIYGANTFVRLFQYIRMVQTATGETIGSAGAWSNDILSTFFQALKPNLWQLSDEGDYTADTVGFLEPNQLQTFTSLATDPTVRGYGSWLLKNHQQAPRGGVPAVRPLERLLFPVTDAPLDYRRQLATYRQAPGAAVMLMRSSWDDSAVWGSFNASVIRWTGHTGRQAGHFTIQRGQDYLLINAAQWKQSQIFRDGRLTGYGGPGYFGNTFVPPTSSFANTLFADDGRGGYLFDDPGYAGGQMGFGDRQPYLVSQRLDSTYVKSDLTHAYQDNRYPAGYDQRAVRLFVRNFVFFAPGDFVVFDRVRVRDPRVAYDLRFYFNSNAPPTISGGVATSTVGASRLFMRPLLPADVSMKVAWAQLQGVSFAPRVELRPAGAATSLDALTVFTAAGTDFSTMPATRVVRSQGGTMIGAQILEPQRERVALFGSAETAPVPGAVTYALTSRGARHYLFDLMPGTTYTVKAVAAAPGGVRVAITPGAGISTDAAGVLAFDLAGTAVTPLPADAQPLVKEPPRPPPR